MVKDAYFTLANGIKIPAVGFGTWQAKDGEEAYNAVRYALEAGYRHIDTAYAYGNETSVFKALADSGLKRSEVFITTKLPSHIKTYEKTKEYFAKSLENLGGEYIDLYLIHAPWPWDNVGQDCKEGNIAAWQAMIKLYNEGLIKAIGVSNFLPKDIKPLVEATGFIPHVNQIRYFIGNTQPETTDYCVQNNILVEAYSPLATGEILNNEKLNALAQKYKTTIAMICLRYCFQKGTAPLPKSVHKERIIANINFDFEISDKDMQYLDSLKAIGSVKPYRS